MAIKVTGYFKNPTTGLIHESPLLTLVPHLQYAGQLQMDVHISGGGTVAYHSIDKNELVYNSEITDGYSKLIDALETYVINNLKTANDVNAAAIFEHYVKHVVVEPIVEEVIEESTEEPITEESSEETTGSEETTDGE